ncbi:MAG: hypothetical protein R3F59_26745 [Myxococcota bacterium]
MATGFQRAGRRLLRHAAALGLVFALAAPVAAEAAPPQHPGAGVPGRVQPPADGRARPTGGQQAQSRAARSTVTVMVVHANHSGTIDGRLSDPAMRKQLSIMGYNGATVLTSSTAQLSPSQSTSVNVEGGRKVQVTLQDTGPVQSTMRIEVFKASEKKLDTTVTIKMGRTFVVAGPKYQDGTLLFPVTVQ